MKKTIRPIIYLIFLVLSLSSASAGNVSINYGWNGSAYIPFKLTSEGKLMTDINKVNLTAGTLTVNNDIISTGNISLGDKIVFGLGEVIDNIVDGVVRITGNLNVTGNAYLNSMVFEGGNLTAELGKFTTLNVTGTSYLGSMTLQGGNITASLGIFTTLNVTGAAYLGNVTIESGNITPVANNTYSLGSPTLWWKDLYLANDSLYIAGTALSASASGVLQWNGTAISNVAVQTGDNIVLGAAVNENVGIGTLTPTAKLDVAGTVNATQFTINGSDLYSLFAELTDKLGNTTAEIWGVADNGTFSRVLDLSTLIDNTTIIRNYNKLGNTTAEIWSVVDNETFARLTGFSGENITSGSVADVRVVDDLTIASTKTINTTGGLNVSGGAYIGGNLGIGTLTPNEKLTVVGSVNITQNLTISGKITGSHKQELEVESIGDVEAGKGMVLLMHFNNESSVGESYDDSGAANSTVYDYSDTENNGTFYDNGTNNGKYNPNSGRFGGAFEFDGVDDYVGVPSALGLGNTSVTIENWVYLDSASESGAFVKVGNASSGYAIGVGASSFDNNGNDLILLYEVVRWIDTNTQIGTGWHHVAMVINSSGVPEAFIDGLSIGVFSGSNALSPEIHTFIGGYIGGVNNRCFNGTIDEVAIYNRSLSADEILEHYKKGFKNVVEGSTVFSDETRVKDNLIVQGNLSGDGDLIINPGGGNVGIGTTSPSQPLHISNSAIPVLAERTTTVTSSFGSGMTVRYTTSGDMADGFGTGIRFDIQDDAGTSNMIGYLGATRNGADNIGNLIFRPTSGNVIFDTGNVGIGTTAPNALLELKSGAQDHYNILTMSTMNSGDTDRYFINITSDSDGGSGGPFPIFHVRNDGNVGIGTTSPGTKLEVNGNISFTGKTGNLNYEEGTWTITMTPATSGTITVNPSFNTGYYTKIGNIVHVQGVAKISAVSSPVGNIEFGTLPFASSYSVSGSIVAYGVDWNDASRGIGIYVSGSTFFVLEMLDNTWGTMEGVDVSANDEFYFQITYRTA